MVKERERNWSHFESWGILRERNFEGKRREPIGPSGIRRRVRERVGEEERFDQETWKIFDSDLKKKTLQ